MEGKNFYSIGEVSRICNISTKTLRFYDKIGIISPDMVSEENNYRFYNRETLLLVPIIKYYKQMGFKLEEMKELLWENDYIATERKFQEKIAELKGQMNDIYSSYTAVTEWHNLVLEAQLVIQNNLNEPAVKYVESSAFCFMEQSFNYNYQELILNIEWTNYLEQLGNEIKGPVVCMFSSHQDKMNGKCNNVIIMQKPIGSCEMEKLKSFGGKMMVSCYHIGPYETIDKTYEKMIAWLDQQGYTGLPECIERYVTDYWTTREKDRFVTEVLIPVERK